MGLLDLVVIVGRVGLLERERERERSERWERRERSSCVYSLYYFNEFYAKIKNKMLSEL